MRIIALSPHVPIVPRAISMPSLRRALATDDMPAAPVLEAVGLDGEDDEELEIYEQPPPGPSLGERHQVDDHTISPLTAEQKAEAARCLRSATMFKFCSDESIMRVVEHMRREQFTEGEVRVLGSLPSCLPSRYRSFKNLSLATFPG